MDANLQRRPVPGRSSRWAAAAAGALARAGVSPNAISVASVVFAALAAAALLAAPAVGSMLYAAAAVLVALRLLANLLDGMVAVEWSRASPTGPLYNEVPDRIADVLILAAAGASAALAGRGIVAEWGGTVGWIAAVGALITAYVRELGRALGAPADFSGPFAKQQRMAAVIAGSLAAVAEPLWGGSGEALFAAVTLVAVGTAATAARRLRRLAAFLRDAPR